MNSNKVADCVFIQSLFISHLQSQVPRWHSSHKFMSCCLQKTLPTVDCLYSVLRELKRRETKVCFALFLSGDSRTRLFDTLTGALCSIFTVFQNTLYQSSHYFTAFQIILGDNFNKQYTMYRFRKFRT